MTTAEATVAALIAHGIDTIYALPGVHNDHLFDALFKAEDRIRTVHTRHEQGAGYMALGAALATGKPQAYAVVPGPGLLNSATALLTAHGTNAPVLALIGQIAQAEIGRGYGHLHEIRDQAGIISRHRRLHRPHQIAGRGPCPGRRRVARHAQRPSRTGGARMRDRRVGQERPGVAPVAPAAAAGAADRRGRDRRGRETPGRCRAHPDRRPAAARRMRPPRSPSCRGMLQAPVFAFRRGRGVLDGRSPFAVTLPLGRELWGEADVVLGIGTRLFYGFQQWGVDDKLAIIRVDADPEEPDRFRKAAVALVGDAAPILRRLIDALDGHKRASRHEEMVERQAKWRKRMAKLAPQIGYPRGDPRRARRRRRAGGGSHADGLRCAPRSIRSTSRAPSSRRAIQDSLGWGYATALGVQDALRDMPVVAISGDGGFMFTATEMATAMHHRIPLTVVVFRDDAFGNVRRIQEERYGNRLIASDLTNPDFVRFAESFGAAAERARKPQELRAALNRALKRRDQPTLIEVPVGPMPSPWEFIHMPKVRG